MKRIFVTLGIIFLFAGSCSEDELNKLNPNQLVPETYYKNEDELRAGVNAIYGKLISLDLFSREGWFIHDLRSDDHATGGGQLEVPRNQVLIGTHDASNFVVVSVWNGLYQIVLRSNIVLEQGPLTEDISEAARQQLLGEAKFARGWAYFELGTLWGGVPIFTEVPSSITENKGRSTQAETLAQAIQDLEDAAAALAPQSQQPDLGRFTQGAAWAMLGRAYMHVGDYAKAKAALENVVNSDEYALVDEYYDNFREETEFNSESIWEAVFTDIGGFNWSGTGDGFGNEQSVRHQEVAPIGWRNLIPSAGLLNEFERPENGAEKRDPRLDYSCYFTGETYNNGMDTLTAEAARGNTTLFDGEAQKISWEKYTIMYREDPGGFNTNGNNLRLIRYAEVLINLAECEAELGNLDQAVEYLNMVRARPSVDMPPYPTAQYPVNSKEEVIRAVIHEKRVEHSAENIRNRDILRWRKEGKLAEEPLSYFVPNKHELLPIPLGELDNNPMISQGDQNPGY
jgi:tetratricopeptide (TPR) repeat protein